MTQRQNNIYKFKILSCTSVTNRTDSILGWTLIVRWGCRTRPYPLTRPRPFGRGRTYSVYKSQTQKILKKANILGLYRRWSRHRCVTENSSILVNKHLFRQFPKNEPIGIINRTYSWLFWIEPVRDTCQFLFKRDFLSSLRCLKSYFLFHSDCCRTRTEIITVEKEFLLKGVWLIPATLKILSPRTAIEWNSHKVDNLSLDI